MAKTTTKLLYEITFWKENRDWDHTQPQLQQVPRGKKFYVRAVSPAHAKVALRKRFQKTARASGRVPDFELASLFVRDDIQIKVNEIREYDEPGQKNCQSCGAELEDDYCQECGLRRESWISVAMQKISAQGKTVADGE